MLPYSPLHHLLLADFAGAGARHDQRQRARTSRSPTATRTRCERLGGDRRPAARPRPADPDAHRRLGAARGRRAGGARGRCSCGARAGTCPASLRCPTPPTRPILACGAELKNTFCVARGSAGVGRAPHRRPRELRDAARRSSRGSSTSSGCSRSTPEVVAHDLHPEYLSTKYALERDGVELDRRPASPRAPGRVPRRARRARDGGRARSSTAPGYGTDGTVWGGELLVRRPGRLRAGRACSWPVRLPGRRAGDPAALADGVRVAGGRHRVGRSGRAAAAPGVDGRTVDGARGVRSPGWPGPASARR